MTRRRSDLARAGRFVVLPTLALAFVIGFAPGRVALAVRIYALVLAGVVLLLLLAALRRSFAPATSLRPPRSRERRARETPPTLGRLEQEVALGVAGSFDLHHRLRPRLHELAAELLLARRGIALDAEPERARAVLGEECWEIVRARRPAPEDRLARGIPISDLARVVESLEET